MYAADEQLKSSFILPVCFSLLFLLTINYPFLAKHVFL